LVEDALLLKPAIFRLLKKNITLKKFFKDYDFKIEKLLIKEGKYIGAFDPDKGELLDFEKGLYLKGILYNSSLTLHFQKIPCYVEIRKVKFEWNKGVLHLKKGNFKINDSPFNLKKGFYNGTIYLIKGNGTLKKLLAENLLKTLVLKKKVKLKLSPLLKDFYFLYKKGGSYSLNATICLKQNAFRVLIKKRNDIFELKLNYAFSNKSSFFFYYLKKRNDFKVRLKGILFLEKLADLFLKNFEISGKLKANLDLRYKNKQKFDLLNILNNYVKGKISLKGSFEADEFWFKQKKLNINFSGKAVFKEKITLKIFKLTSNAVSLKGNFQALKERKNLIINGEIKTEFADLRKFFSNKKQGKIDWFKFLEKLPVKIKLNLNLKNTIVKNKYQIELNNGTLIYRGKKLWLKFLDVRFCDLRGNFFYKKEENFQWFYLKILPSNGELLHLASCIYQGNLKKISLDGLFTLKGFLYGEGKEKIWERDYGEISFLAKDGYIYRAPPLAKILAFLSPIDLFKGKIPHLGSEALQYDKLQIKAFIYNSKVMFNTIFLSAAGFRLFGEGKYDIKKDTLNFTFYASPFKTIDVIVENVPLLGKKILGKEQMLIFFPFKVSGTREKYSIIPLHPVSLGKEIKDFILRFFGVEGKYFKQPKIYKYKIPEVEKKVREEFNF